MIDVSALADLVDKTVRIHTWSANYVKGELERVMKDRVILKLLSGADYQIPARDILTVAGPSDVLVLPKGYSWIE